MGERGLARRHYDSKYESGYINRLNQLLDNSDNLALLKHAEEWKTRTDISPSCKLNAATLLMGGLLPIFWEAYHKPYGKVLYSYEAPRLLFNLSDFFVACLNAFPLSYAPDEAVNKIPDSDGSYQYEETVPEIIKSLILLISFLEVLVEDESLKKIKRTLIDLLNNRFVDSDLPADYVIPSRTRLSALIQRVFRRNYDVLTSFLAFHITTDQRKYLALNSSEVADLLTRNTLQVSDFDNQDGDASKDFVD